MSIPFFRTLSVLTLAAVMSGCTAYSTAVNSLGPEPAVSDLKDLDSIYVLNSERPLFCPAPECYMVLPEEGAGVITVTLNNGEEYVLEGDYETLCVTEDTRDRSTGDQALMDSLFSIPIDHLPPAPINRTLYFELDTVELTADSKALIDDVYAEVLAYPAAEVIVSGHTDTQASPSYNIELSQRRAERVRDNLIERGIEPEAISVRAKGETDLLVPTADGVDEPLNRRVVIQVR